MADQTIIRPQVHLTNGGSFPVQGLDGSSITNDRLDREFDRATSAEEVIDIVIDAIEAGITLWSGTTWFRPLAAQVTHVTCVPFD
jgi:hypothetical protein